MWGETKAYRDCYKVMETVFISTPRGHFANERKMSTLSVSHCDKWTLYGHKASQVIVSNLKIVF